MMAVQVGATQPNHLAQETTKIKDSKVINFMILQSNKWKNQSVMFGCSVLGKLSGCKTTEEDADVPTEPTQKVTTNDLSAAEKADLFQVARIEAAFLAVCHAALTQEFASLEQCNVL